MSRRIVFLFLFFVSAASHASFFYRADTRPPQTIFSTGFAPLGSNPSLFQHVVGFTCQPGQQTTGFVATSSSESFAVGWGRDTFAEGTHFYVYRIRASPHFYNAAQSLFHASNRTGDNVYEYAGWTYIAESEWVFAGRVIALLLLIVVSAPSQASFFYRMDTRPPEEVFQHGFSPSGNHPSLFQHVVGQTCQPGLQTSGFIAVSANETFAVDWGRETQPEGTRFYVYRIRASEFFYNAVQSLFHASRQTGDLVYELAGWIFMAESEWVTPVGIPAEDIVGAAEYVSRGRNRPPGRVGVFIPSGARESAGTINHAPFTWNYTLDQTQAPPAYNPLCPSVCFGANHTRHKRSTVEWIEGDDGADEARAKSNHLVMCTVKTASAALGVDLLNPEPRPTDRERIEL